MSPLVELTVVVVVVALLVGILWLVCFLFVSLHEFVDELVHDEDTFFVARIIAGLIYVCTSIVMFFFGFILTMIVGYGAYKSAEQVRNWWNK